MPRTITSVSGSTNQRTMNINNITDAEQFSQLVVINQPSFKKRGLMLNRNGRITLRALPIKMLGLKPGDKIVFVYVRQQMYLIKSSTLQDAIKLSGRKSQLHGNSVTTVKHLFLYIDGLISGAREVDLIVGSKVEDINIDGDIYKALPIITRAENHFLNKRIRQ